MLQKLKKNIKKQFISSCVNVFWLFHVGSFWRSRVDSIRKSTFVLKRIRLSQLLKMSEICIFSKIFRFYIDNINFQKCDFRCRVSRRDARHRKSHFWKSSRSRFTEFWESAYAPQPSAPHLTLTSCPQKSLDQKPRDFERKHHSIAHIQIPKAGWVRNDVFHVCIRVRTHDMTLCTVFCVQKLCFISQRTIFFCSGPLFFAADHFFCRRDR